MTRDSQESHESEAYAKARSGQAAIINDLINLKQDLTSVFSGSFDLIVLEGRLAAVSLVWQLALGLMIAVALISVWVLLMMALGFWLNAYGYAVEVTLLLVALLNIVLSFCLWLWMRRISRNMTFKASRRHLSSEHKVAVNASV